jgi:hypothetical protein
VERISKRVQENEAQMEKKSIHRENLNRRHRRCKVQLNIFDASSRLFSAHRAEKTLIGHLLMTKEERRQPVNPARSVYPGINTGQFGQLPGST